MKTVTKTFYVSDKNLQKIKTDMGLIGIFENKNSLDKNQIQISWQEPEKKIELSESEFDEILISTGLTNLVCNSIKLKLFGASDE